MDIAKKPMNGEELDKVSGGSDSGFFMTVDDCNGSYLALRSQPCWDKSNEIAQLWPDYHVYTYGATTNGTGLNGTPCTYWWVEYNGKCGWADASFLY